MSVVDVKYNWRRIGKRAGLLLQWMAEHNLSGYYAANELDRIWSDMCASGRYDYVDPTFVRKELRVSGFHAGKRRLGAVEYDEVRKRNGISARLDLYKIPTPLEIIKNLDNVAVLRSRESSAA